MMLFPLRKVTVWSTQQINKQNDLMVLQSAMTGIHSVCYQHSEEGTPELDQSWEWAARIRGNDLVSGEVMEPGKHSQQETSPTAF